MTALVASRADVPSLLLAYPIEPFFRALARVRLPLRIPATTFSPLWPAAARARTTLGRTRN